MKKSAWWTTSRFIPQRSFATQGLSVYEMKSSFSLKHLKLDRKNSLFSTEKQEFQSINLSFREKFAKYFINRNLWLSCYFIRSYSYFTRSARLLTSLMTVSVSIAMNTVYLQNIQQSKPIKFGPVQFSPQDGFKTLNFGPMLSYQYHTIEKRVVLLLVSKVLSNQDFRRILRDYDDQKLNYKLLLNWTHFDFSMFSRYLFIKLWK